MSEHMPPVHPGEILSEEYLQPRGMTIAHLARATGVPSRRLSDIVQGRRPVSAEIALRLAKFFGSTPEFWINLQTYFDLETARDSLGSELERVTPAA